MQVIFSIITPMYKGADFVAETIESVIRQSEQNWEMIIVDDCSPDDGAGVAIVKKFADTDSRIKLIQLEKNRGSSGARNEAMRNAQGRYFAFLDSDDLWDVDYLKIMFEHINVNQHENAAIFFSGFRRLDEKCVNEISSPYSSRGIKKHSTFLYYCPIFPSAAIVDTEKVNPPIYFREELRNLRDDYAFWLDITKQGLVAIGYSDILVSFRFREGSATRAKRKMIIPQWNIYRKIVGMNVIRSSFYLCTWAINGMIKIKLNRFVYKIRLILRSKHTPVTIEE